jgi:phosphatidate cytidylyltransferase
MAELYTVMGRVRPPSLAGFLTVAALALTALYAKHPQNGIVLVLVLSVPLTFFLALLRPRRENVSWAMAVTFLGIVWIGLGVTHAVLLRGLDHGGALVLDVLIGTFVGDTAAYFGGRAWGRRRLAPSISPNKTLEGLLTGIVGGTVAFWLFAVAYQHEWFLGPDALLIGFCVALAGPVGDLFESLIKRDLEVKDTGRFFGAHGGVLDRLDAVLFTVVAGYYVSRAVLG